MVKPTGLHWRVQPEAYVWRGDTLIVISDAPGECRWYDPDVTYPDLFMTFADCSQTKEGVLTFAQTYGMLLCSELLLAGPRKGHGELQTTRPVLMPHAEELKMWLTEIKNMHLVVDLWRWLTSGIGDYHVGNPTPWVDLTDLVNSKLAEYKTYFQLRLAKRYKHVMTPVPENLLHALWCQFASAIAANAQYNHCRLCKKLYRIEKPKRPTQKLFCSTDCTVKNYSVLQTNATKLRNEGKSLDEIAKELGLPRLLLNDTAEIKE